MDAPLIQGGVNALDLVYNSNNVLVGMNSIDQQVLLAISTVKGTAIVPTVGSNISDILQFDSDTIQAQITNEVEIALNLLIKQGSITLDNVSVIQDSQVSSRLNVVINYTNLRLNIKRTLSL